ncbi:hypothetical protein CPB84DRAFT_1969062 [Gymnopilus junonius]|uniref:Ubiquitin-like protease family profile domain-containing protein n=1 Tax=Gymnopilus junonius TaxID=109634 RepID=A0A9P5TEF4_GYMJU|nr:hypothetical protein CPB84DRAFT_1969062 [Gymnopilus junonius]
MLYLLEREVCEVHSTQDIHFIDTVLARKILHLYSAERDGTSIYEPSGPAFWQVFGSKLTPASRIGGIFHINNNHWVAAVVNAQLEELAYGDPAGHPTNVNVEGALWWYASKHIPTLKDKDQLDFAILSCASQDIFDDWWSCGIFSYNALAHCFACHPLLTQTENPIFTDLARMTTPDECVLPSRFEPNKGFFSSVSQKLALGPPIIPRPQTPPNSTSLGLAHALKQLSVSPKKHQQKKRKTSTKVHPPVLTLKFQLSHVKASVSTRKEEDDAKKAEARLNK